MMYKIEVDGTNILTLFEISSQKKNERNSYLL